MNTPRFTPVQARILTGMLIAVAVLALGIAAVTSSSAGGSDAATPETSIADTSKTETALAPTDDDAEGDVSQAAGNNTPPTSPPAPPVAKNSAPAITDPGVSSKSLTIEVTPTVSDPDGDTVTMAVAVDGSEVPNVGGTFTVSLDRAVVGLEHTATVRIVATDSHGAQHELAVDEHLSALDTVTVSRVKLLVSGPGCFLIVPSLPVTGSVELAGPVSKSIDVSAHLTAAAPSKEISPSFSVEVDAATRAAQTVETTLSVIGTNFHHLGSFESSGNGGQTQATAGPCFRTVHYTVTIDPSPHG